MDNTSDLCFIFENTLPLSTADRDLKTDSDTDTDCTLYDDSLRIYKAACKRYGTLPLSQVIGNMHRKALRLNYLGLGETGIRTLAIGLVNNMTVTSLELRGNVVNAEGVRYLTQMLTENSSITHLDLSDNPISCYGSKFLCQMLMANKTLCDLKLSGTSLTDGDAVHYSEVLKCSTSIIYLDISYNAFSEHGGILLGSALGVNSSIKELNLSWNHLRLRGATAIADALKTNKTLEKLNLAWNGFANMGAIALGKALKHNACLTEIDLSSNRINLEGAIGLTEALWNNTTLTTLKLNRNSITPSAACHILHVIKTSKSTLLHLELQDIEVNLKFEQLLQEIRRERKLEVLRGGCVRNDVPYDRGPLRRSTVLGDPLSLLMEYVKNSNLRLMDLFTQFDKDNSWTVSRDELRNGMQRAKVPLNDNQIERLLDKLDTDKDGEINFAELLEGQRKHREKERRKAHLALTSSSSNPSANLFHENPETQSSKQKSTGRSMTR